MPGGTLKPNQHTIYCNGHHGSAADPEAAFNAAGFPWVADCTAEDCCDGPPVPGCQSKTACNYNAAATSDGVACVEPDGICQTCSGETDGTGTVVDNDTDADGVCNADEVAGCQSGTACNYNAAATDDGVACVELDGICETCSGKTDGTGTAVDNDTDDDGVCNADEVAGCQSKTACNYNAAATDGGVVCVEAAGICTACSGETDGTGTAVDNDADNDGICDPRPDTGCQGLPGAPGPQGPPGPEGALPQELKDALALLGDAEQAVKELTAANKALSEAFKQVAQTSDTLVGTNAVLTESLLACRSKSVVLRGIRGD
jgi:hypothetical protein